MCHIKDYLWLHSHCLLLHTSGINTNIQTTTQEKEETPIQNERLACMCVGNEYPLDSLQK